MKKGATLAFAHGFNIISEQIGRAPISRNHDRAQGPAPRALDYTQGGGVPSLIAVYQDPAEGARRRAVRTRRPIGAARAGVIETTFREECETTCSASRSVLCGGLTRERGGYDTLVDAGYAPEMAYFECVHEVKLIVDLIYEGGIANMRYSVSNTAEYGDFTRGPRIINEAARVEMKKILNEIQTGQFAKEFILENRAGVPTMKAMRRVAAQHPVEVIGAKLRDMMPWIKKNRLVDQSKN